MDFFREILNFSIVDVLDIILVATLLYYAYKLLKGTVAINIFTGIILIYILWRGTLLLEMELLSSIRVKRPKIDKTQNATNSINFQF